MPIRIVELGFAEVGAVPRKCKQVGALGRGNSVQGLLLVSMRKGKCLFGSSDGEIQASGSRRYGCGDFVQTTTEFNPRAPRLVRYRT